MVELFEKSGVIKIIGSHPLGTMDVCAKFQVIHLIVVKTCHYGAKWCTNITIPSATQLWWLQMISDTN